MKDKNLAAVLAFFGGSVGLHRFYLGQVGLGIVYIFLMPLAFFLGIIDAISFLSMDQQSFDMKYNKEQYRPAVPTRRVQNQPLSDRERRYQQRQRERAMREKNRRQASGQSRSVSPMPSPPQRNPGRAPGYAEREAGLKYFRDFEYDRAIIAFQRALEKNPKDIASHFNIACSYSCEEEADKAFYHLDRAVSLGFDDFSRIRNHDSLAFLRVQPEFEDFALNGFRLVPDRTKEESLLESPVKVEETTSGDSIPENEDLLEQLQRLATLKEKGLLTEGEFVAQKKRLLG
jgi:TM2 domain-containing membrane protein YozV